MIRNIINQGILLIVWMFFSINIAHGQDRGFYLSWEKDGAIIGSGLTFYTLGELAKSKVKPLSVSEVAGLNPINVNRFDRSAIYHESNSLDKFSDYFLIGSILTPLTAFSLKNARSEVVPVMWMFFETGLVINGLTNIAKRATQRVRPFAYNPDSQLDKTSNNARYSFFSSHVSNAAAFSFLTAYMINEYVDSQIWKIVAWCSAVIVPAGMGFLRYASGRHFPTDILGGYVVGAGIGLLIPRLHRTKQSSNLSNEWKMNWYGSGFALTHSF